MGDEAPKKGGGWLQRTSVYHERVLGEFPGGGEGLKRKKDVTDAWR